MNCQSIQEFMRDINSRNERTNKDPSNMIHGYYIEEGTAIWPNRKITSMWKIFRVYMDLSREEVCSTKSEGEARILYHALRSKYARQVQKFREWEIRSGIER